ncbi:MAG: class II fructose-bisphosphate aldolase [Patescibacteria group bacterium]|jgi:fructose-bisphosphate aldolase class II
MRRAYKGGWAIGAFNTSNLETSQAIIEAAEELRAPVIIQTTEKAIGYAGVDVLSGMVKTLAARAHVPVILNLDHGRSLQIAQIAARHGYTALMIDGSKLPFKKNLSITRAVVKVARAYGIGAEGELGTIGGVEDFIHHKSILMTEPEDAQLFVRQTGVDILAVAFGSSHGLPVKGEHLDFTRLAQIRKAIPGVPLVFHGASSTRKDFIKKAIRLGVCKINIDTDIREAFSTALRKKLASDTKVYDTRDILSYAREAVKNVVKEKIRMFGSAHKA